MKGMVTVMVMMMAMVRQWDGDGNGNGDGDTDSECNNYDIVDNDNGDAGGSWRQEMPR